MKSRLLLAVGALVLGLAFSGTASAQYSSSYGFGYGFGRGMGGGWMGNNQIIPYFSQYPPVYYSHPVARPYGFSPYAAPPGIMPAEMQVVPAKPAEIINPYFKPEEKPAPAGAAPARAAPAPRATTAGDRTAQRMINNPYFHVTNK